MPRRSGQRRSSFEPRFPRLASTAWAFYLPARGRDVFGAFVRGVSRLGCVPDDPSLRFDVTPVAFASRAIASFVANGDSRRRHIANRVPATVYDLGLPAVPVAEFRTRLVARRDDLDGVARATLHAALDPLGPMRAFDLFEATQLDLGAGKTLDELERRGITCPSAAETLEGFALAGADMTRGMVLGKFMPPHLGHVYLVDFARAYVDDLAVVVGTLAREPIPGALRYGWMCELFPTVQVVHLTDENPQEPHEHPRFWDIWRESLLRVLPWRPDYVFASETYGEGLRASSARRWVPVDVARAAVPVSATAIRADPLGHWRFIPRCVRPHFVRRIAVVGPESSGKSTLAAALAQHYRTTWVPEYARALLEPRPRGESATAPIERAGHGAHRARTDGVRGGARTLGRGRPLHRHRCADHAPLE